MILIKVLPNDYFKICRNKLYMQIENNLLINDLLTITDKAIAAARNLKSFGTERLNSKPDPESWSAMECIEHLNLYGDFYLPEIEKRILARQVPSNNTLFKSGWMGNYFAELMHVKNGTVKKMKSPKDKNPVNSLLSITTIDRFLKQLELLKTLLIQSRNVDLTKTRTSISLTKYITTRLGDTFRFFVYHIERHILQAEKALAR